MKKGVALILLCVCLSLSACGKSKTVKAVEAAIDGIGEVTLDSGAAIETAEKLLHILTENEKEKVDNRIILVKAREKYDKLVLEALNEPPESSAIEQLIEQKTQSAIASVLPGGCISTVEDYEDATGLVTNVYQGESGYALEVKPNGFGGPLTMMVGIRTDGEVQGIAIISHSETAGLGAVAASASSAGEAFRSQFTGKSGSVALSRDGGELDAVTGATITSRAICDGVNAALRCVAGLG